MIKENFKKIFTKKFVCGLIIFLLCVQYASIMSFKSAPITEGWYTEYAWKINHGSLPYRDFEYLFFPLYIYIIAGFTKIFGYSIFALRVLGIFVFASIGCTLYAIYTKLFNEYVGIVVSFVSVLFMQSENAQIFYDYIRFHDLFAMATVLLLLYLTDQIIHKKKHINVPHKLSLLIDFFGFGVSISSIVYFGVEKISFIFTLIVCVFIFCILKKIVLKKTFSLLAFLTGIFVACEFMIKQSNGTIMIMFVFAFVIIAFAISNDTCFMVELIGIFSGITLAISVLIEYLIISKSYRECITCCLGNAISAKGGLLKTLFAWLPQCFYIFENKLYIVAIILIVADILLKNWSDKKITDRKDAFVILSVIFIVSTSIVLLNTFCSTVYEYNSQLYDSSIAHISFFMALGTFIFLTIDIFKKKNNYYSIVNVYDIKLLLIPVLGASIAQGYGCAMSGGLAPGNTYLCLGLIIGSLLWIAIECKAIIIEIIVGLAIITMSSSFISCKTNQMYYWWYLASGTIDEQTEKANVPLLDNIKMTVRDKTCYETIYNDIATNTEVADHIYVFPNAPIFYTISDRHSITYSQVEWFDVSSEDAIDKDIQTLRQNNPKMIIYVSLPEAAYSAHESLFDSYQTRKMRDFLLKELIPNEGYTLINSVEVGEEYSVQTFVKPYTASLSNNDI